LTTPDASALANRRILFRTRVKFCGMTRAGDVRLASELGVDAVGFVFSHGSPRRIRPEEARLMRNALAPLVDAVALFRDKPNSQTGTERDIAGEWDEPGLSLGFAAQHQPTRAAFGRLG